MPKRSDVQWVSNRIEALRSMLRGDPESGAFLESTGLERGATIQTGIAQHDRCDCRFCRPPEPEDDHATDAEEAPA